MGLSRAYPPLPVVYKKKGFSAGTYTRMKPPPVRGLNIVEY